MPAPPPSPSWQGPLRAAVAVFVLGFLFVWLIKPIGNPCPDLERLPQGSSASSSPSFAPPGARTCTYTAAGGTKATSKYVPWLDWIVLLLLAAVAGGAVAALSPAAGPLRVPKEPKEPRAPKELRAPKEPREPKEPRAPKEPREPREPRAAKEPRASRSQPAAEPSGERDAAERERARQERAARHR